ncbi:unnamed protein product [Cunninghamella echinulata]
MCHIINLPQEIYKNIAKYMNTSSILGLSRTCRKLFHAIRNDSSGIWETLDYTEYGRSYFKHYYGILAMFLSHVLTTESRKTIKYIHLNESYNSCITQRRYHTIDQPTNIADWHLFVKTVCPNLISTTFNMHSDKTKNPPPDYLFTIGYNINNPLFKQYNNTMECDLYISRCEKCPIYACSNSNSNFLCIFHEEQRNLLI